jgi:dienelactone hydrolase
MRSCIAAVICSLVSVPLSAQHVPNRFRLSGPVSGSEEYTVTRTATGTVYAGTTKIENRGMELAHQLTVAPDGSFRAYTFSAAVAGHSQTITATRDGEQIQLRVQANERNVERTLSFTPATVVTDNGVVAHFQALLDRIVGRTAERVSVLVPQSLSAFPASVSEVGEDSGMLDGQPVRLRKYTLELPQATVEIWAAAGSNQLMRVFIATQKFEIVRVGFVGAAPQQTAAPLPADVVEREVTFPSAGLQFRGTLCLPKEPKGKVPLLLLVHGSGPHDRDETISKNKPFRDLALELASAGIATLRYDKRTYAFGVQLDPKTLTLDQEVTDDAVAALNYAATLVEIDASRLFVVGHSLGGTMAPYIAQRYPKLRGMILMAAGARPIDQISSDQARLFLRQAGKSEAEIAAAMKEQTAHYEKMRSADATEVIGGVSAGYWRDWEARDPAALVKKSAVPVLVLQGGQDFHVFPADFEALKTAIAGKPDSRAQWFPELNHLFMPGKIELGLADYDRPSHVAPQATQAIAQWVKERSN